MGLIRNYMTIGGKSTEDFNIYISGEGTFASPERDYETVSVPGRNGDLTFDNGRFKNRSLTYPAFITRNYKQNLADLEDYLGSLRGYVRLEDTYHPDEFRMGIYKGGINPKNSAANLAGEFDLTFDVKPQRFLKEGERVITFTSDGIIKNPTYQEAKPLIRVYGTGTVGVGSTTITIYSANEYTDIDCETMDAYKGATNCNGNISVTNYTFPVLKGETGITLGGSVTKVEITPRWWRA
jgi:phage-related protein